MKSLRIPLLATAFAASLGLAAPLMAQAQAVAAANISSAETAAAYKKDAARHVYKAYADKVYKGKLPPLIHAVVVLEVSVDNQGNVQDINTIRVPTHAPDVTAAVKDMIQRASPMPAPSRMGGVKFTEVWLVDKSGRFQLDTLSEGQR
ncbi:energy transducer TonB family protein [Piscinibacter terrae]|uniref:Energy transducer TonB n=1 Tax=Piscinibacter terrae TaxID=2496871 RepID=A0A3N7HXA4_9BURK|nr:energy transducer TonB [Albitalea terrae]RQP26076.1 energy transducer TonB [Albitalea terrae]